MHPDWKKEIERLEYVKQVIADEYTSKTGKADGYKSKMRSINKYMWEEIGPLAGNDSISEFLQYINVLKQNLSETDKNSKEIKKIERQLLSPYFARIDFKEDGWDNEKYYIGVYGFRKDEAEDILIYDWRAPVSSMFYDYEPGRALYVSPSGKIEGDLSLKRQYRIEKGELILLFDSNIAIDDDILQDILAGSSDKRMKIIVSTIQREQNKVIRSEGKRVLAVQGAAGSGKTSIALHRAAYLLYKYRETLKAGNIILFTPNEIFSKYISTVLPELGEDDIPGHTLDGLAKGTMGTLFEKYETYADMMEWQLLNKNADEAAGRLEGIRFKASGKITDVLEKYVKLFENNIINFENVHYEDAIFATGQELDELFHVSYSHMQMVKRLSRMELKVMQRINEYRKLREPEKEKEIAGTGDYVDENEIKARSRLAVREELDVVYKKIKKMFSIDIVKFYKMLFENVQFINSCGREFSDTACRETVEIIQQGILYYEDQAPVLYLMSLLGMLDHDSSIRHVIIDEAQDYSGVAYKLFSRLYPRCDITLLGDLLQNINPLGGIGNLKNAGEIIDPGSMEYIELDKSYRSTVEITEFTSRILPSKGVPYGRHGKKPEILTSTTIKGVCDLIVNSVKSAEKEGVRSVAVICRTLYDCRKIYKYIRTDIKADLIAKNSDEITGDIIVIPSYLAKGLEFDVVIAAVLSEDEYMPDEDQLFYTVCTRALHRLDVCAIEGAGVISKVNRV